MVCGIELSPCAASLVRRGSSTPPSGLISALSSAAALLSVGLSTSRSGSDLHIRQRHCRDGRVHTSTFNVACQPPFGGCSWLRSHLPRRRSTMVVFFFDAASSFKLILVFSTWRILLEMGFHARSHSFAHAPIHLLHCGYVLRKNRCHG